MKSRDVVVQIKENRMVRDDTSMAMYIARRWREEVPDFAHEFFFERYLVPVPRSSLSKPGALWPAFEIAQALAKEGFGAGMISALSREKPVPKAAWVRSAERPSAEVHFESLALADALALPTKITLVDDVITRGAQVLGAAWRIETTRPDIDVRAFAVVRTLSNPSDFTAIVDPRCGVVTKSTNGTQRRP